MAKLEEIKPNCQVKGILLNDAVTIFSVQWHGLDVIEVSFRGTTGVLDNELIFRDRESDLEVIAPGLAWSFDADPTYFRLISEAYRIRMAYLNYEDSIQALLLETYCYLLVPSQEGNNPVEWLASRFQNGDSLVQRASKKLKSDQQLITEWSPALLRMELDRWLWKDSYHISIWKLWEYLAQYLYLPRLKDEEVLLSTIRAGVSSPNWQEYFAYAAAVKEDGTYMGLVAGSNPSIDFNQEAVLVKPEVAIQQLEQGKKQELSTEYRLEDKSLINQMQEGRNRDSSSFSDKKVEPEKEVMPRHFYGTVELDADRIGRDAGKISEEVLVHLTSLVGAKARVILEIDVEVPAGIPEEKVKIISENCKTLKFKGHGFE